MSANVRGHGRSMQKLMVGFVNADDEGIVKLMAKFMARACKS